MLFGCGASGGAGRKDFSVAIRALKVEPTFDQIVEDGPGLVKDFALTDTKGALHDTSEWANRPAIVLFFLSADRAFSDSVASELTRLLRKFGQNGVLFLGVLVGRDVPVESAATLSLAMPILLDPNGRVARQTGVRVSPEAVVLGADGQVFYRGRISPPNRIDLRRNPGLQMNALESVLDALVAGEMPVVASTEPIRPLSPIGTNRSVDGSCEEITFTEHVAPILWRNCVSCHRPGQIGPFSLLTYKDAAKRATFLYDVAASGRMPPEATRRSWCLSRPATSLGDGDRDSSNALGRRPVASPAIRLIFPHFRNLTMAGTSASQTSSSPCPSPIKSRPKAWTFIALFFITYPLAVGTRRSTASKPRPATAALFTPQSGSTWTRRACPAAENVDDPEAGFLVGWTGTDGRFDLPYPGLGAWTPGMTPRFAPDGVGRLIRRLSATSFTADSLSSTTGKAETDKSSIVLFIAKKPATKTMAGYTLCTDRMDIPPGEKRYKVILSTRIKADIHLYTVVPHAHHLCREFRLAATLPDGTTQPLLWITDWDMDWQDQYRYARPVRLPRGAIVTLAAYFDNSEDNPRNPNKPPRRVRYGVQTTDEMCACHLEFLCDNAAGQEAYKLKSPFGL